MPVCAPPPDVPGVVIVVDKSDFSLAVYKDRVILKKDGADACFDVALGGAPVGDKLRQGDEHTPVGVFRVTHKNPKSAFHLSLGLDYPQARHGDAGYAAGIIDAATRDRVVAAAKAGKMPVRDSRLGGDIYIHGGGTWVRDWTDGCVALDNANIEWLYATVGAGTKVHIQE